MHNYAFVGAVLPIFSVCITPFLFCMHTRATLVLSPQSSNFLSKSLG